MIKQLTIHSQQVTERDIAMEPVSKEDAKQCFVDDVSYTIIVVIMLNLNNYRL